MISANFVIGHFKNITASEMEISVPNAQRLIFSIGKSVPLDVSLSDNSHFVEYTKEDGIIEIKTDNSHGLNITKMYVKVSDSFIDSPIKGEIRVWVG
jgi:hypothetical protein